METFHQDFERRLTAADSKQHIPFSFSVPAGTRQVEIRFRFAPLVVAGIHNLLTLSLFDPAGWRGAGHRQGNRQEVVVGEAWASPGYQPGPVPAGSWTVVVDVHLVMPGPEVSLHLDVAGRDEPVETPAAAHPNGRSRSGGPGWYCGDLHAHTFHSDAHWDAAGLTAFGRSRQLDFVALTDHNTVSGQPELQAAAGEDLLPIPGMELTTFWGHALALGVREWVDWRVEPGRRSMAEIAAEVKARGGLFIIAHPKETGDPYCTGCDWRYPQMMPGPARAVEVWNGDWASDSNNEAGLQLVSGWLNAGHRLALTAGTDNHGLHPERKHYGYNHVYAEELSVQGILSAIRAGRLFLSAGPHLELEAVIDGRRVVMGESLPAASGEPVQLTASWQEAPPGAQLDWMVDGAVVDRLPVEASGARTLPLAGGQAHWCLACLRAANGWMLALTNPVYLDGRD